MSYRDLYIAIRAYEDEYTFIEYEIHIGDNENYSEIYDFIMSKDFNRDIRPYGTSYIIFDENEFEVDRSMEQHIYPFVRNVSLAESVQNDLKDFLPKNIPHYLGRDEEWDGYNGRIATIEFFDYEF
jgi:hypothetical protein